MNYEQSFALAEFVDNSIQSFLDNKQEIMSIDGKDAKLKVEIVLEDDQLSIIDNAGGINEENYQRAFLAGARAQGTIGLSEFGMGMKASACWYSNNWEVVTTALGEPVERTVSCDMDEIFRSNTEDLEVTPKTVDANSHYTIIKLSNLHHRPYGKGYAKIREYLASIYRLFLQTRQLELYCFDRVLSYPETTKILYAPHHSKMPVYDYVDDVPQELKKEWKTSIDFESQGMRVSGFAALRGRGAAGGAGFSLFRRKRLIVESYLPEDIFGKPNSAIYQRLFGELHIEGLGVSFAKDKFNWNENEESCLLDKLKGKLERLIDQAKHFPYRKLRSRPSKPEPCPEPESRPEPEQPPNSEPEPRPEPEQPPNSEPEPRPEPERPPDIHTRRMVSVTIEGEEQSIYLEQHIVYFLQLPEGGVIKIGITTVSHLRNRIGDPQRYFVEDVECLGVILCKSREVAEHKETELLETFGRANPIRNQCELIWDHPDVRTYIAENCKDPRFYVEASRSRF